MSDVVLNLANVNLDILLLVVKHDLTVHDLLNIRRVCRRLRDFASHKSAWIAHLRQASQKRPLPLPPFRHLSSLSLNELIDISLRASNLQRNWSSLTPEARPAFKLVTFPTGTPQDAPIVSMLLIPQTPYVLTLSVGTGPRMVSWITCVDTEKGKKVAKYRTDGLVSTWRAEPVAFGIVVVALLIGPEDRSMISPDLPAHYNVVRLGLPDARTSTQASFAGISSHLITSPITGMFLTTEVAGLSSVIRGTQTSGLLMTRFRDGTTAYIDTTIPWPVFPKPNLNTIANQADLILYCEDNAGACAFAYSFPDDLHPHFTPSPTNAPQRLIRVAPSTVQSYKFDPNELCEGADNVYTIIRARWRTLASARLTAPKPGQSEISVLSMAYYLGADPNGSNDHRCISHMYLDPFKRVHQRQHVVLEERPKMSRSGSSDDSSKSASPPVFTSTSPSEALSSNSVQLASNTPSPTLTMTSDFGDDEHHSHDSHESCHSHQHQRGRDPKKPGIVHRTFHSCLEEKREIWQGPSRNDLISIGLGASHAIWLSAGEAGPELKLASFEEPVDPLPLRNGGGEKPPKVMRTLKLPSAIHAHEISALALDDANGVIALATMRCELWLLDYAVAPTTSSDGMEL